MIREWSGRQERKKTRANGLKKFSPQAVLDAAATASTAALTYITFRQNTKGHSAGDGELLTKPEKRDNTTGRNSPKLGQLV